jgi:phosphate transport system substrate-binding protein
MKLKFSLVMALTTSLILTSTASASEQITGSGSSFIANYLDACRISYAKSTGDTVTYSSLGSGAGRNQLSNKIINFAGSDTPFASDEQQPKGYVYVPFIAGPIAIIYRLDGYNKPIQLSKSTLAKIFAGQIVRWNDKSIIKDNTVKGIKPKIPSTPLRVAFRADGSGTSQIFTEYFNAVNPNIWKKPGNKDFKSAFPGTVPVSAQAGSGSHGVVMITRQMNGAITYAELSYASGLKVALIENSAGKFIKPSAKSASQFLSNFQRGDNGIINANYNNPNPLAYNLSAFSYIIAFKEKTPKNTAVKEFLSFSVANCKKDAVSLGYAPLSGPALTLAKLKISEISTKQ